MASVYHSGIPIHNGDKYVKDPTVLDALKGLWVIGSHDYPNNACPEYGVQSQSPCGTAGLWNKNWYPNVSPTSFSLSRLQGPDQVGIRSSLSLVSWERSATSSAESSPHCKSITATACSLGHTEPHRNHWIPHRCRHAQRR